MDATATVEVTPFSAPVDGSPEATATPTVATATVPADGPAPPTPEGAPPAGSDGQAAPPTPAKTRADYVREALEGKNQRAELAAQRREAQQLAQLQEQHRQQQSRLEQLEAEARTDPLAFMRRYGHTFDDIARRAINMPAEAEKPLSPREQKMQAQLEELAKWRSEQEQQRQQAQQAWQMQQAQQAVRAHIQGRLELAAKTPDEFELVTQFPDQAGEMYRQTYARVYNEVLGKGRDLNEDEMVECMRYVEGELEKRQAEYLAKLEKSKKFASRFAKKEAEKPKEAAPTLTTITNEASRPIPAPAKSQNGVSGLTAQQIRDQREEEIRKDPRFAKLFAQ